MLRVSPRTLNVLAALVWYLGGIVLLTKGGSLLVEAKSLRPGQVWPWLAIVVALIAGGLQARFLFSKSCRKNLDRIAALELRDSYKASQLNSNSIRISSLEFDVGVKCHSTITDVKDAEKKTCGSCPCKTETPKCAAKSVGE